MLNNTKLTVEHIVNESEKRIDIRIPLSSENGDGGSRMKTMNLNPGSDLFE